MATKLTDWFNKKQAAEEATARYKSEMERLEKKEAEYAERMAEISAVGVTGGKITHTSTAIPAWSFPTSTASGILDFVARAHGIDDGAVVRLILLAKKLELKTMSDVDNLFGEIIDG